MKEIKEGIVKMSTPPQKNYLQMQCNPYQSLIAVLEEMVKPILKFIQNRTGPPKQPK
jgi:hypothetical protein